MRPMPLPSLPKTKPPCPRIRQQQRYSSRHHHQQAPNNITNTSTRPPESQSHNTPGASQTQQLPPSSTIASSAGASAAPVPARSFRDAIKAGPLGRLGRAYSRVQARRPYATQLCSSVVVYLCGDLSAQLLFPSDAGKAKDKDKGKTGKEGEGEGERGGGGGYDPWRTMRHLTVGIGSSIPSYNWFMFLHHSFNFASKPLSILTKVVVQQSVFTPVFNTYFFSVHSLLSGSTVSDTFERLKKALPVSITNSVKLWPAVTAFSFLYVPAQFRNVFAGVIAVGWQTYLSWLNQKAAREVDAEERRA